MCLRRFDDNSYTGMQFLRAVSHSVGAPQQQALWCTHRLWQRHLMKNNLTLTPAQTPSSRPSPHQTAMYTSWLYRVCDCDILPTALLWGLRKRRGMILCMSFLTFSWDTLTVHWQVDLDEFGVIDFVPSTRFCMLSVRCYCIMLLAGCFLLTLLV